MMRCLVFGPRLVSTCASRISPASSTITTLHMRTGDRREKHDGWMDGGRVRRVGFLFHCYAIAMEGTGCSFLIKGMIPWECFCSSLLQIRCQVSVTHCTECSRRQEL